MTAIELRTTIASDLDQMSEEMLESVHRYVRRLRRASSLIKLSGTKKNIPAENDMSLSTDISPRVLLFKKGHPWYASDEEVDELLKKHIEEKYQ